MEKYSKKSLVSLTLLWGLVLFSSCKDDDRDTLPPINYTDSSVRGNAAKILFKDSYTDALKFKIGSFSNRNTELEFYYLNQDLNQVTSDVVQLIEKARTTETPIVVDANTSVSLNDLFNIAFSNRNQSKSTFFEINNSKANNRTIQALIIYPHKDKSIDFIPFGPNSNDISRMEQFIYPEHTLSNANPLKEAAAYTPTYRDDYLAIYTDQIPTIGAPYIVKQTWLVQDRSITADGAQQYSRKSVRNIDNTLPLPLQGPGTIQWTISFSKSVSWGINFSLAATISTPANMFGLQGTLGGNWSITSTTEVANGYYFDIPAGYIGRVSYANFTKPQKGWLKGDLEISYTIANLASPPISKYVLYKFTGNVNSDIEKGFYEGNIPQFSPWIAVKMWPLGTQEPLDDLP